jgi:hypothetical protein
MGSRKKSERTVMDRGEEDWKGGLEGRTGREDWKGEMFMIRVHSLEGICVFVFCYSARRE